MIEWLPTARALVVRAAWLPTMATGDPRVVTPSMNWTVPLSRPPPGAVTDTMAVSVTDCPRTDGLSELATAVEVAALLTEWETGPAALIR